MCLCVICSCCHYSLLSSHWYMLMLLLLSVSTLAEVSTASSASRSWPPASSLVLKVWRPGSWLLPYTHPKSASWLARPPDSDSTVSIRWENPVVSPSGSTICCSMLETHLFMMSLMLGTGEGSSGSPHDISGFSKLFESIDEIVLCVLSNATVPGFEIFSALWTSLMWSRNLLTCFPH